MQRAKLIALVGLVVAAFAVAGCGSDGGAPMPDNDQIRKENPNDQRAVTGNDSVNGVPAKE